MVSRLLGFIFGGNANCVTRLCHALRFGERFICFQLLEKQLDFNQHTVEKECLSVDVNMK